MPLYEYACQECRQDVTLLQPLHATAGETACPYCGQTRLVRLMSSFATKTNGNPSFYPSPPRGEGRVEGSVPAAGGCGCTPRTCGCGR